ncbi:hypothetical protein [Jiangella alkaliphila]|uniref:Uncharacterized protein n=1 Tax=Jiangella alkaliphila TaxID=419479 RepID=A0A1H2KUG9_9ACTN|nr:hypothetical protein [Jiangella alkaliphila]SDU71948.1 hypothetical protein SAMN04488563_4266 [Jiangella alkaliphila]
MTHDENALRAALTAATVSVDPGADVVRRARDGGRRRLRRHRVQVGAASVLTAAAVVSGVVPLLGGGSGGESTAPQPAAPPVASGLPTGVGEDCEDLPAYGHQITVAELPDTVRLLWPDDGQLDVDEAWPRMETGPCGGNGELSLAGVDDDGVIERLAVVFGPGPADAAAGTAPGTLVPGPEDGEAGGIDLAWLLPDGQQLRVQANGFTRAELEDLAAVATLQDGVVDLGGWPEQAGIEYVGESAPARSTHYGWDVAGPQGSLSVQMASGGIYGWALVGDRIVDNDGRPAVLRGTDRVVWSPEPGVIASLTVAEGLDPLDVAATVGTVPADDPRVVDAATPDPAEPSLGPVETPSASEGTPTP